MVPADDLTPKGTDIGINIYIDRALAGALGQGRPALHAGAVEARRRRARATSCRSRRRSSIAPASRRPTRIAARPTARPFDRLDEQQREEVLVGLSAGKINFDNGLPARAFWTTLYQTVMEGMFSDPIYGGNRNKAGWKLIGFPGAIAVHRENVEKYHDKKFPADPLGIADMS